MTEPTTPPTHDGVGRPLKPQATETSEPSSQERAEWDRERRLIDQTMSMQAHLRDRYRTVATAMTCTILAASTVGIAFAFAANDGPATILGVSAERTTLLGWLAVVTFILTLIDLILDMRGAARQRQDAVDQLADLKSSYYAPIDRADERLALERLRERYRTTMGSMPPIPERQFNRLKSKHLRKVEVSKLLSQHPGISQRRALKEVRKQAVP